MSFRENSCFMHLFTLLEHGMILSKGEFCKDVARSKRIPKENPPEQAQVYDTTFKDWIHSAAPQAIPFLLPGSTYEGELNVEHTRPSIRADKVFNVNNQGDDSILHIEFETGAD